MHIFVHTTHCRSAFCLYMAVLINIFLITVVNNDYMLISSVYHSAYSLVGLSQFTDMTFGEFKKSYLLTEPQVRYIFCTFTVASYIC